MSGCPDSLDDVIALEKLIAPGIRLRDVEIEWDDETRSAGTIRGELSRTILDAIKAEIEGRRRVCYDGPDTDEARGHFAGLSDALAIIEKHEKGQT